MDSALDSNSSRKPETSAGRKINATGNLKEKYTVERKIGQGSQGSVYLATRRSDGQKVSIKRLDINSIKTWKEYTLFKREGDVLKSLDIDGVAKCYETIEHLNGNSPCAYIVQAYIRGKSLQAILDEGKRLEISTFYDIVLQLLTILEKLHGHEPCVIHRDIKPSNILLQPKLGGYKAWLIDFGAVSNPQIQGGGSTVAGTYGYMPPEQLMGAPEPASDIYALGAVIVYVLSGVSPGNLPSRDFHLMFEPELQSLHPAVVSILRQMLEPDVHKRLCDISVLKHAFSQFKLKQYDDLDRPQIQAAFSLSDYNKKLKQVQAYGMPGNIDLWSMLPDARPDKDRDPLPAYQDDITNVDQIGLVDITPRPKNAIEGVLYILKTVLLFLKSVLLFSGSFVFYLFIIICALIECAAISIIVLAILSLIITNLTGSDLIKNNFFEILLLIVIIYGIFITYHTIKQHTSNWFRSKQNGRRNYYIQKTYFNSTYTDIKDRLLVRGIKTIATVTEINYCNVNNALVDESIGQRNPICYGVPTFEIVYIFNPPFDARKEDLKHRFYTHRDPEGCLAVGDPLPILYDVTISTDSDGDKEWVYSMPFPIVLDDPISLEEVVGKSSVDVEAAGAVKED